MSKEILDDLKEDKVPRLANLSFRMLNVGVGFYFLFVIVHLFFWQSFEMGNWFAFVALFAGLAGTVFTGLGIFYGMLSVNKKEKNGRKNYYSLFGSVAVFLFMGWLTLGYVLRFISFLKSLVG